MLMDEAYQCVSLPPFGVPCGTRETAVGLMIFVPTNVARGGKTNNNSWPTGSLVTRENQQSSVILVETTSLRRSS